MCICICQKSEATEHNERRSGGRCGESINQPTTPNPPILSITYRRVLPFYFSNVHRQQVTLYLSDQALPSPWTREPIQKAYMPISPTADSHKRSTVKSADKSRLPNTVTSTERLLSFCKDSSHPDGILLLKAGHSGTYAVVIAHELRLAVPTKRNPIDCRRPTWIWGFDQSSRGKAHGDGRLYVLPIAVALSPYDMNSTADQSDMVERVLNHLQVRPRHIIAHSSGW